MVENVYGAPGHGDRQAGEAGQEVEVRGDATGAGAARPGRWTWSQVSRGFPRTWESPWVALMGLADGISVVHETIFENRFGFTNELIRMGAKIKVDRNTGIIRGVQRYTGAPVEARDIRGGAAAGHRGPGGGGRHRGVGVQYIDRGYTRMEESWPRWGPTSGAVDKAVRSESAGCVSGATRAAMPGAAAVSWANRRERGFPPNLCKA